MTPGHTYLLFDQIEVVVYPLAGRRKQLIRRYRFRQYGADVEERIFVLIQPRQELIRAPSLMIAREMPQGCRHTAPFDLH